MHCLEEAKSGTDLYKSFDRSIEIELHLVLSSNANRGWVIINVSDQKVFRHHQVLH